MKLYLARHASSGIRAGRDDHERTLTAHGRRDARGIGSWLAGRGARPVVALYSSAHRAVETVDCLLPELPAAPDLCREDGLYLASASQLLDEICGVEDGVGEVLVVAHNPGVGELAARLAGAGDRELRERLDRGFPEAALAEIAFGGGSWPSLKPGAGELLALHIPGEAD